MSYEVFARKYRPQTFDDIVGQTHVTRTLKNAVAQNRLAHAYLFVGPRGTGKTSTARILAKALNCTQGGPTVTPCGKCDNCREIAGGNSLDVIELDAASNRGIDDVRELRDNVRYAPAKSRFKVYIIDEVHMLTKEAANALLKTLEEPPKHVIFCLATTEPEKLPITILSRCQRFDLHRIATNLIAQQLQSIATKEKLTLAPAAAHAIARGAEGGMRDAESMLDQLVAFCGEKVEEADVLNVFGFTSQQMVADFVGRILRGETADALALLHEQCEAGKDMMKLMSDTIAYLRDLLVFKVKPDALSDEASAETRAAFAEQAPLLETDRVLELIDQFAAAEGRMKWAPNKKLHVEVAVIRAIQTLDQTTLDEVIENLNALRDGNPAAPPPNRPGGGPVATVADRGPGVSDAGYKANDSAADVNEIWGKVVAQIKTRRPFIKSWIDEARPLGASGRNFELGFPCDQRMVMEHLSSRANREFLEALLKEISGREWALKFSLKENLPAKAPAAKSKNAPAIVREALEMFKGEIKT
ncbi:MAG: DNA polymerase III subunit gamma/tau [Verrucomicrobia bacterium]|nr:MAG: DNA polymerase III subunit gamma/tau [Verrucomicrobiota bacterium]